MEPGAGGFVLESMNAPNAADARREIRVFLLWLVALSSPFYLYVTFATEPRWAAGAFMWTPGLAALAARLWTTRRVRGLLGSLGLGWRRTHRVLPEVIGAPWLLIGGTYTVIWASDLGAFDPARLQAFAARFHLDGLPVPLLALGAVLLVAPLGAAFSTLVTLGEELGWRGLLTPRMLEVTSFGRASLAIGVIWALWHYPPTIRLLPVFRPEVPVWFGTLCFTVTVVLITFFYTWLWLRTHSVWPAALLHAASAGAQETCEALTRNTGPTAYWTFEFGAGFVITMALLLGLFWRRLPWTAGTLRTEGIASW